jgi:ubiquitin carboxyl-terminal hydrolase 8
MEDLIDIMSVDDIPQPPSYSILPNITRFEHTNNYDEQIITYVLGAMSNIDKYKKREYDHNQLTGLTGLHNIGNTCYLSSVLQSLSNTIPVRTICILSSNPTEFRKSYVNDILKKEYNPKYDTEYTTTNMITSLHNLFVDMYKSNWVVNPQPIKKVMGEINNQYNGNRHCDAHECLLHILDNIHETTCITVKPEKVKFNNIDEQIAIYMDSLDKHDFDKVCTMHESSKKDDILRAYSYIFWKHNVKKYSIITNIFNSMHHTELTCSECGYIYNKFDIVNTLELPIIGEPSTFITLDDCLRSFTTNEMLVGDERWECHKCKKKVNTHRSTKLWKLPEVLIITLKRFVNMGGLFIKNDNCVYFPIDELDMAPYVSLKQDVSNMSTKYQLYSTINHMGSCEFGHYVSNCKNDYNDIWYHFNDHNVKYKDDIWTFVNDTAYILFYKRI